MKFSQKNFENWQFWKTSILKIGWFGFFFFKKNNLFCLIPMKISHKLCDRMNGTQFWCFPLFPANSLLCVIIRYTVYLWKSINDVRFYVLGSSLIWTCQILNIQYLLLFPPGRHTVEKIKTNIQNLTCLNRWATEDIILNCLTFYWIAQTYSKYSKLTYYTQTSF